MKAAELISRANTLITNANELSIEERLNVAQSYSKDFELWYAQFTSGTLAAEDMQQAEELLKAHDELVRVLEKSLEILKEKMGKHRKVGKSIIAYADFLPKRISIRRGKKG